MYTIVIGNPGSDGGYTTISNGKVTRHPGWQQEAMVELATAAKVMQSAVSFKKPGLTEATVSAVIEYVEEQIREHLGESVSDGVVLIL